MGSFVAIFGFERMVVMMVFEGFWGQVGSFVAIWWVEVMSLGRVVFKVRESREKVKRKYKV